MLPYWLKLSLVEQTNNTIHNCRHEHAARLLVPTTVLSPFPPLSGWRKSTPLSMGDACLFPSSLGYACLFSPSLDDASYIHPPRVTHFISTLLWWRIYFAYATSGSPQGIRACMATASPLFSRFIWRWHRLMSLTHQWINVRLACMPRSSASPKYCQLLYMCPVSLKG